MNTCPITYFLTRNLFKTKHDNNEFVISLGQTLKSSNIAGQVSKTICK